MADDPQKSTAESPTPTPPSSTAPATPKPEAPAAATQPEQEYFFPAIGKTVSATSREEAEKKVAALSAAENN